MKKDIIQFDNQIIIKKMIEEIIELKTNTILLIFATNEEIENYKNKLNSFVDGILFLIKKQYLNYKILEIQEFFEEYYEDIINNLDNIEDEFKFTYVIEIVSKIYFASFTIKTRKKKCRELLSNILDLKNIKELSTIDNFIKSCQFYLENDNKKEFFIKAMLNTIIHPYNIINIIYDELQNIENRLRVYKNE